MYGFLSDAAFLDARERGRYFLFSGALSCTPSWDEVLLNVERSIEENSLIKLGPYLSIVTHNGHVHLQAAADFLAAIRRLDPSRPASAHVYIGLTRFSESFGRHRDNSDVFFWQVLGRTSWKVYAQDGVQEHTLGAGDVLYVPKNMDHEVRSLCPRVGISFGLDYGAATQ